MNFKANQCITHSSSVFNGPVSSFIFTITGRLLACLLVESFNLVDNHNHNNIAKSDWLSTALISALIGQFNRTVRVMPK